MSPRSYALLTPSFSLDYERCRLLVESVRRHVDPSVAHYLLVDRRDEPRFSDLRSSRTQLRRVEDIVPGWLRRVPFARQWWLSLKTLPVRNWMLQQLVKLSADRVASEDVLIFVDSDTFFIRSYDPSAMDRGGRIALFREFGPDNESALNTRWHNIAGRLLGLPPGERFQTSYVGNLIPWRRENLVGLHARVEQATGRPWLEAACRMPTLSEYVLYGRYCESVLGEAAGVYFEPTINSLCHWPARPLDLDGLRAFRERVNPAHVAVMVSAKSRTPVESIRAVFADLALSE